MGIILKINNNNTKESILDKVNVFLLRKNYIKYICLIECSRNIKSLNRLSSSIQSIEISPKK
jgi:hypothetical protein